MRLTDQAVTTRRFLAIAAPAGHRAAAVAIARPLAILPEYVVARFRCECGFECGSRDALTAHQDLAGLTSSSMEAA